MHTRTVAAMATVLCAGSVLAWTTPAGASAQPTTGTVRPACSGTVSASPSGQTVTLGFDTALTVTWNCQGGSFVRVNMDWGDGSTSSYTCLNNCGEGQVVMHKSDSTTGKYSSRRTYTVRVSMSGFASGNASPSPQVDVT
jgi:hypothetical protein